MRISDWSSDVCSSDLGRMTSMLVLLFLYLGYIALANASSVNDAGGRGSVSRVTAIFGLVGAISIPLVKRFVVWWNSVQQGLSITLRGSTIDSLLLWPLGLPVLGFSFLLGSIVLMRLGAILAQTTVR